MRGHKAYSLLFAVAAGIAAVAFLIQPGLRSQTSGAQAGPPFKVDGLTAVQTPAIPDLAGEKLYNPKNPYGIFINYELGMHCVGFDMSYCCIIPPYNSIQAQAVRSGLDGRSPQLLSPSDNVKLFYYVRDNSYSEGNKMKYWSVLKDANGNGSLGDPNDNMANYVWTHLFIYKDLAGTLPKDWTAEKRLRVGREVAVPIDHGPSGKPLAGGYLDYAGPRGGNIVFTDSLLPEVKNVGLVLTASSIWDALGLPLTAFYDSRRIGTIRTVTPADFQPFQYATVELRDANGQPVTNGAEPVRFFGTNPADLPNCFACHSGKGPAAELSRKQGHTLFEKEYAYWKTSYPDESELMARLSASTVNVLELHDASAKTDFLRDYRPDASSNRLGEVGAVNCADCHGDNISGNLQSPRFYVAGYKSVKAKTLSQAIHSVHAQFIPMPDKAGRTQSCQACHPTHWQDAQKNNLATNPLQIIDDEGRPRFGDADQRNSGGGCYLRRDAMSNPHATPPFFLNEIGRWFFENVSTRDAAGARIAEIRGLMCTNCHNALSHALYANDDLTDAAAQSGRTLRDKPIAEVIKAVAGGDARAFADFYADPKVNAPKNPLLDFWAGHKGATMVMATKDAQGNLSLLPWNAKQGSPAPYDAASGGSDWWLAPAEPHCANCHMAPFVESAGGAYFPIDQPGKYSLYRYSKAHADLACQSCHQSIHGSYPVRFEGDAETVDLTTHQQALQFSPDGAYAGPVTCAACHTVNANGVPAELKGTEYYKDYWSAVVLIHSMRGEDYELKPTDLVKKFPYARAKAIVAKGWK